MDISLAVKQESRELPSGLAACLFDVGKKGLVYRLSSIYDITMKTTHDISDFESLAAACKALSHPARLNILQTLASRGSCICGEIVDSVPLSQATVSQHLKVLKDAGLITGQIDGTRSCYCINHEAMNRLRERFSRLFGSFENCC
jgi:DNA-binding transcriptional ArsR family regulator